MAVKYGAPPAPPQETSTGAEAPGEPDAVPEADVPADAEAGDAEAPAAEGG